MSLILAGTTGGDCPMGAVGLGVYVADTQTSCPSCPQATLGSCSPHQAPTHVAGLLVMWMHTQAGPSGFLPGICIQGIERVESLLTTGTRNPRSLSLRSSENANLQPFILNRDRETEAGVWEEGGGRGERGWERAVSSHSRICCFSHLSSQTREARILLIFSLFLFF